MIKNKKDMIILGLFFLIGIFLISLISAQISYCCEKTTYGAWCQNEEMEKCDPEFRKAPTSCEATSYCRQGCCYNSQEGTCLENTPQKICGENNGVWNDDADCNIPQCELGCCLIGEQAAFVTQTRCKRLSNLYGLEINFKSDITDEFECVISATANVEGACVFTEEFEKTCKRTTQKECNELKATKGEESEVDFYSGKLCSNEELGTNCAPSDKTSCFEEEDAVFWIDTCGNKANVYDSSKRDDKNYWGEIKDVSESCGYGTDGNPGSRTCGNCDYFLGTTCKEYDRGKDPGAPNFGDNICRDLGCTYEGKRYEHGESWCVVYSEGEMIIGADSDFNEDDLEEKNRPGSRYFRLLCYNNEVIVEPCADFRQEICLQDDIGGFRFAACRVNRWQDCTSIKERDACENSDKRDCVFYSIGGSDEPDYKVCVPKYSPGLNFWSGEETKKVCDVLDIECKMEYEAELLEDEDEASCEENCDCDDKKWHTKTNDMCLKLGDCGSSLNYLGYKGYYGIDDLVDIGDIEEEEGESSGGLLG